MAERARLITTLLDLRVGTGKHRNYDTDPKGLAQKLANLRFSPAAHQARKAYLHACLDQYHNNFSDCGVLGGILMATHAFSFAISTALGHCGHYREDRYLSTGLARRFARLFS